MIKNTHVIDGKTYTRVYIEDKPTKLWRCGKLVLSIHVCKVDKYGRVQTRIKGKPYKIKV